ncbi:hypothetical protein ACE01N_03495 [Saccharicrinis sp. FJH2]|uniref:hypothetical protein n=1 Tax=Saccharicrinis sp. FJH65 TaxID=3344659 RepID=UPI0035F35008
MQFIQARIYSTTPSVFLFAVLISLTLHVWLESPRLSAFGLTCKVVKFQSNGLAAKVRYNAPE